MTAVSGGPFGATPNEASHNRIVALRHETWLALPDGKDESPRLRHVREQRAVIAEHGVSAAS